MFSHDVSTKSLFVSVIVVALSGCSREHGDKKLHLDEEQPKVVSDDATPRGEQAAQSSASGGVIIPAGSLPKAAGETLPMPGGGAVHLRVVAGERFVPIEGTFNDVSYRDIVSRSVAEGLSRDERRALLASELSAAVSALRLNAPVVGVQTRPEVGYFRALVPLESYPNLAHTPGMTRTLLINPVVTTPFNAQVIRKPEAESAAGLDAFDDARSDPDAFSGLERVRAIDFAKQIAAEVGVTPDGRHVTVGVADTGVTFNHPTFADDSGQSRVVYLKDFTDEGRIFFHPDAMFDIRVPDKWHGHDEEANTDDDAEARLYLSAEFLVAPEGAGEDPVADELSKVEDLPILVSPELRETLTTPHSGARLGVLSEAAYNSAGSPIDINRNGKNDDNLWALLIPGKELTGHTIYVDVTGRGDFRNSAPLRDFNVAHEVQPSFQEKFGLSVKTAKILDSDKEPIEVITAAVVGFDPGNHGSHVSGIIAGRKTIANAPDDTLARGVAPATHLMVDRVCANSGGCDATDALIDLAENGAEVVNVSIGGLGPDNDGYGVGETIIDRLTAQYNTLFFISAGNEGPGRNTVGSPSVARFAISVGATASRSLLERQYQWPGSGKVDADNPNDDDFMLFFSSRGPTAAGGFKPDLTAPGTELSSVQLNAPVGSREGLDVYWGTSMAAPTATGSAALFIDAIKAYNEKFPATPLPLDALTLRRVITTSARPFDVSSYNLGTQESSTGQYTWIDQGYGMLDLTRAWAALKTERDSRLPTAVTRDKDGQKVPVALDYEARVLFTNPNGAPYDGTSTVPVTADTKAARIGRGIWLDATSKVRTIPVQIARRLPPNLTEAPDVADLTRALNTTADEFKLETVVYGSKLAWVSAGVLNDLDSNHAPTANVTVVGAGAIDQPINPETMTGGSVGPRDSTLYVFLDHDLIDTLPPGDHGALINAYRTVGGVSEKTPAFVVPVSVTVPHKTLAGKSGYTIEGTVHSFGVARNYVSVPKGTKLVKVALTVPAPTVDGTLVTGCAGVSLNALEGANTAAPPELASSATSRALGCDSLGRPTMPTQQRVTYARQDPTPGVWDLHVFGLYQYAQSPYKLDVQYAQLTITPEKIDGQADVLSGAVDIAVQESSFPLELVADQSVFELRAQEHTDPAQVAQDEDLKVPDLNGKIARSYDEDVAAVEIKTGNSMGNDIDLTVKECDDEAQKKCRTAGKSGSPTDEESVVFNPTPGKFYVAIVAGFEIKENDGKFDVTEALSLKKPDTGKVTAANTPDTHFEFSLDPSAATLLQSERFKSGQYTVTGAIELADANGTTIITVPVTIHP